MSEPGYTAKRLTDDDSATLAELLRLAMDTDKCVAGVGFLDHQTLADWRPRLAAVRDKLIVHLGDVAESAPPIPGGRPEIPFIEFPKIHRWNREIVITEKIDGTNACVHIDDSGQHAYAACRTRWVTPSDDNFGFARWVAEHHDELLALGPGMHFGEWWGAGIQRRYGLTGDDKRFSLFSVGRWSAGAMEKFGAERPACCGVVPVLARGALLDINLPGVLEDLRVGGSMVAPGFMQPEGIVVFHEPSRHLYKYTLDKNDGHKGGR